MYVSEENEHVLYLSIHMYTYIHFISLVVLLCEFRTPLPFSHQHNLVLIRLTFISNPVYVVCTMVFRFVSFRLRTYVLCICIYTLHTLMYDSTHVYVFITAHSGYIHSILEWKNKAKRKMNMKKKVRKEFFSSSYRIENFSFHTSL